MTQEALFFTADDVLNAIENDDNIYESELEPRWTTEFNLEGIGKFEVIDAWSTGEDWGGDKGYAIKHIDSGRTFAREGTWASYDGDTWDTKIIEVEVKPVTVYRYTSLDGKKELRHDVSV